MSVLWGRDVIVAAILCETFFNSFENVAAYSQIALRGGEPQPSPHARCDIDADARPRSSSQARDRTFTELDTDKRLR